MAHPLFEGWSKVLYGSECAISIAFVPVVLVLFYICGTQKNLHINFRIMLFMTAVGYLMYDLTRLTTIILLTSCSNLGHLQNVDKIAPIFNMATNSFYSFSWLFLIIERAIASAFVDVYEKRFAGAIVPTLAFFFVTIITVVIVVVRFSGTAKNFDGYLMGLEISIAVLTCVALAVIIIFNKSSYRKRHNSQMHLTNRYQLDENIRVGNYLMPVAINQMLIKIMLVVLTAYAVFFTAFSLGEEEDFVYHAYCQLFVYERLFFVLVLILRSEKFSRFTKRTNRTAVMVQKETDAANNYFKELKQMW